MTKAKPVSKAQERADLVERIFSRVDPEVVAAGVLGAIAVTGGVTPPLTRMLQTFNEKGGDDYLNIFSISPPVMIYLKARDAGGILQDVLFGSGNDTTLPAEDAVKLRGLMAAAMMEGMMMMTFMKNKEAMQSVVGIARSAIEAAGEALPF